MRSFGGKRSSIRLAVAASRRSRLTQRTRGDKTPAFDKSDLNQRAQGVGGPRGSSAKDLISSRGAVWPQRVDAFATYFMNARSWRILSVAPMAAFWSFRPVHGTHLERVLRVESTLRGSDAPRTPARPRCRSELDLL